MKLIRHYKITFFLWIVFAGLIFNVCLWIFTSWQWKIATDLVPLHYNIYFGPDLFGDKNKLYTYPLIGLVILCVNAGVALFFKKEKLLLYFLSLTGVISQIIMFLTELSLIINYY